ncbi:hypothetical protein NDU88_007904 [Pleurodeles waltl]|uniref:Secreted protein n=1 Tax=Pleurodeles waltl TaxID=8319 RepID=A0AAV7U4M1_PLEWA|nr:hypothetical protein NDU88_007904 [Pleurodeles waltl]
MSTDIRDMLLTITVVHLVSRVTFQGEEAIRRSPDDHFVYLAPKACSLCVGTHQCFACRHTPVLRVSAHTSASRVGTHQCFACRHTPVLRVSAHTSASRVGTHQCFA